MHSCLNNGQGQISVSTTKYFVSVRRLWLVGALGIFVFSFEGCKKESSEVVEKVPDVTPIANSPELKPYVLEFSTNDPYSKPVVAVSERAEPSIPVDLKLVDGRVFHVD